MGLPSFHPHRLGEGCAVASLVWRRPKDIVSGFTEKGVTLINTWTAAPSGPVAAGIVMVALLWPMGPRRCSQHFTYVNSGPGPVSPDVPELLSLMPRVTLCLLLDAGDSQVWWL